MRSRFPTLSSKLLSSRGCPMAPKPPCVSNRAQHEADQRTCRENEQHRKDSQQDLDHRPLQSAFLNAHIGAATRGTLKRAKLRSRH